MVAFKKQKLHAISFGVSQKKMFKNVCKNFVAIKKIGFRQKTKASSTRHQHEEIFVFDKLCEKGATVQRTCHLVQLCGTSCTDQRLH